MLPGAPPSSPRFCGSELAPADTHAHVNSTHSFEPRQVRSAPPLPVGWITGPNISKAVGRGSLAPHERKLLPYWGCFIGLEEAGGGWT
jgi:hypothetical protein